MEGAADQTLQRRAFRADGLRQTSSENLSTSERKRRTTATEDKEEETRFEHQRTGVATEGSATSRQTRRNTKGTSEQLLNGDRTRQGFH